MNDRSRYPKFNAPLHARPVLSMYGASIWGELAWLVIPIAVITLALLLA